MNQFSKYFKGDKVIWIIIIILSIISLLVVFSSTASLAYKYQQGNTSFYLFRHLIFIIVGLFAVYVVHRIPYKAFFGSATVIIIMAFVLLFLTWIFGSTKNEATRWITIPGIGIDFQTSDFAKFALIVFLAKILSMYQKNKEQLKRAFIISIATVISICALILPSDLSTAVLLFATSFILMFIGRINKKYLLLTIGAAIIVVVLFISVVLALGTDSRFTTWNNRITSFVDADSDLNFQAHQSKIAIATGTFTGKGVGQSTQRTILPHPYSDFIYAIIVEEYGAITGIIIIMLYLVLLFRTARIIRKQKSTFPAFLAIGLILNIIFQAFINMAVAVNIVPVTGQPLPLVSMGGTSILFTAISLGIVLNISQDRKEQTVEEKQEDEKFIVKDYPFLAG